MIRKGEGELTGEELTGRDHRGNEDTLQMEGSTGRQGAAIALLKLHGGYPESPQGKN